MTSPQSDEALLEELAKLEREATAGPWQACGCGKCGLVWSLPLDTTVGNASGQPDESADAYQLPAGQQSKNAECVAAIFNALPRLLSLARAGRAWEKAGISRGGKERAK